MLATKYGAAELASVLAEHGPRIAIAVNGLQYLGGILATRRREGRRPIGMAPPPPKEARFVLVPCANPDCDYMTEVDPGYADPAWCDVCRPGGRRS
jgi:hypothetical protein